LTLLSISKRKSRVKEIIFAKVGDYFTHYRLENGDIIYRGYTSFKKLSGNSFPFRLAVGDLVVYTPTDVSISIGGKLLPAISP